MTEADRFIDIPIAVAGRVQWMTPLKTRCAVLAVERNRTRFESWRMRRQKYRNQRIPRWVTRPAEAYALDALEGSDHGRV